MTEKMYRDRDCNSLRKVDIGKQVTLAGWVHVSRDHGGVIFVDLRDREGLLQVVFDPDEAAVFAQAQRLRNEFVIRVQGRVRARPAGTAGSGQGRQSAIPAPKSSIFIDLAYSQPPHAPCCLAVPRSASASALLP